MRCPAVAAEDRIIAQGRRKWNANWEIACLWVNVRALMTSAPTSEWEAILSSVEVQVLQVAYIMQCAADVSRESESGTSLRRRAARNLKPNPLNLRRAPSVMRSLCSGDRCGFDYTRSLMHVTKRSATTPRLLSWMRQSTMPSIYRPL
jgi:hypothetical protein